MANTVRVRIPAPLVRLYGTSTWEMMAVSTVAEIFDVLAERYPGLNDRLREPDGRLRRWVNVFVADQDIRLLQGVDTPLQAGDEVRIVPAVAGGR